jgi:hypothetical protein
LKRIKATDGKNNIEIMKHFQIHRFMYPIQNLSVSFNNESSTSQVGSLEGKAAQYLTCDTAKELKRFGKKRGRKQQYISEVNGQKTIIHKGSWVLVIGM